MKNAATEEVETHEATTLCACLVNGLLFVVAIVVKEDGDCLEDERIVSVLLFGLSEELEGFVKLRSELVKKLCILCKVLGTRILFARLLVHRIGLIKEILSLLIAFGLLGELEKKIGVTAKGSGMIGEFDGPLKVFRCLFFDEFTRLLVDSHRVFLLLVCSLCRDHRRRQRRGQGRRQYGR